MTDLYRILSDLSRQMVAEGYPVHCAMDAEALILSFLANQGRKAKAEADAARAMPRGAARAAESLGCHRSTVYRRAHRLSRKSREVATS
jgi:hypothetical protein